jgi:predicted acylesterase/phospholipase RssA
MSRHHTVSIEWNAGLSIGGFVAVLLSWHANHSVGWAVLHFFCSWFYVLYAVCTRYL